MEPREYLAEYGRDADFDVNEVELDDEDVFEQLTEPTKKWWAEEFGQYVEQNNGFFTPPQKEAIPHVQEDENTLVASPTGSGKCIRPSESVLIKQEGNVKLVQAGDLEQMSNEEYIRISGGKLRNSDLGAYSFNEDTGDTEVSDMNVFTQQYEGQLIGIETKHGREVEVTPDHPLLVETIEGYEWKPAKNITEEDRLGVPESLDLPEKEQKIEYREAVKVVEKNSKLVFTHNTDKKDLSLLDKKYLTDMGYEQLSEETGIPVYKICQQLTTAEESVDDKLKNLINSRYKVPNKREIVAVSESNRTYRFNIPTEIDEEVASWVSFVCAEGHVNYQEKSTGAITVSQSNRTDILEDFLQKTSEIFGQDMIEKETDDLPTFELGGLPVVSFICEVIGVESGSSHEKSVPDWVLNAPRDVKKSFVSVFFSAEATSTKNGLEITQADERTIDLLNYVLLSFGIFGSVDSRKSSSTNGSDHKISLNSKNRLKFLDTFEENLGSTYEVSRRSGYMTEVVEEAELSNSNQLTESVSASEKKSDQNVMFLDVNSIERKEYEGEIVDLNVPDNHNFIGGKGGMYLHNTLTAFTTQIDRLFERAADNELENSVYCLYVSPLKSLANDIKRNLESPLEGIQEYTSEDTDEIRHAIRHGDTPSSERQEMLEETPHILNTTPETLAILLNSPKFKEKLKTVETVVVDEIHSLASNKRGVHLSLSLERLEELTDVETTRIGCSATVEPLDEVAKFLVGYDAENNKPRDYEIVDTRFVRDTELNVKTPVDDLINTPRSKVSSEFYGQLNDEIEQHSTTIIFTNTRSGAESTLTNLRMNYDHYDESNSAVHHGSLGKSKRVDVEERLKNGEFDVVTTSTSLELGIDMGDVDLVIQVGSPKSIASLLQRIGRAGHQLGQTVEGKLFVLDRNELVECSTMAKQADEGFIDRVFIPHNCQDVATQHVYGMGINSILPEDKMFDIIRSAYPYHEYDRDMFHQLLRYMTSDYEGLEDRSVYPKVWWDENDEVDGEHHYDEFEVGEKLIGKRGKQARVIYYTNIGTIPDTFSCTVNVRGADVRVGELDEEYLNTLDKGDVFQLGGSNYEYRYRRGSKVYVDRTSKAPTVPSWFSERLPLSYDLGLKILDFQEEFVERSQKGTAEEWLSDFPIDDNTVQALIRLYENQVAFMLGGNKGVSTGDRMVVEEHIDENNGKRNYYFQSCYGREFNDGMSRLLAQYFAERKNVNVQVAVNDQGFAVKVPKAHDLNISDALQDIDVGDAEEILRNSLSGTDFLKRYFRINATRSLMILRNYKGNHKSAKQQQVSSEMLLGYAEDLEEFSVVEETYREIMEDKLNVDKIRSFVSDVHDGNVEIYEESVSTPSPRSFSTAALASEDVIAADDESEALKEFHDQVVAQIEGN